MLKDLNNALELYGIRLQDKDDGFVNVITQSHKADVTVTGLINRNISAKQIRLVKHMIRTDATILGFKMNKEQYDNLHKYISYLSGEVGYAMAFGKKRGQ